MRRLAAITFAALALLSPAIAAPAVLSNADLIAYARSYEPRHWPDAPKDGVVGRHRGAEVVVLQVLHAFDLKTSQLKEMARLAAKTAQKPPPRKGIRASDNYRKALAELRLALVDNDDDRIDKAHTALDALREKENPDFDDVEITDAARKQAPRLTPDAAGNTEQALASAMAFLVDQEPPGGGIGVYSSSQPTNVYVAYPGSNLQIEVFDPSAKRAQQLVASGQVTPVP